MNPRHRRYLIPGLLVALLVVAAVASLTREAEGAERGSSVRAAEPGVVSTVDDARLAEASGMALDGDDPDLAYVINDSGNDAVVFAVRVSTGEVVGAHPVQGTSWVDTEAMAREGDRLWIADVGDNRATRDDLALYAITAPGPGESPVEATRYPVRLAGGPADVESVAVREDGSIVLITKELAGRILRVADPRPDRENVAEDTGGRTLGFATDAAALPGDGLLVRGYASAVVLAAGDLDAPREVATVELPAARQGETVAIEPGAATALVGSEGVPHDLERVALPSAELASPSAEGEGTEENQTAARGSEQADGVGRPWLSILGGVVGVVILATFAAWAVRRE